jgi:aspartate carbamoyltransferase catalytic subunit
MRFVFSHRACFSPARWQMPAKTFAVNRTSFVHHDILSVSQFSREDIGLIFDVANEMRAGKHAHILKGHILASLFYEPSTRTQSSFMAAMQRLGGGIIPISEVRHSSVSKGESLRDTVRTLECYADVIVLRHHEVGAAKIAAEAAQKPIINAGDGVGEHPTQALLDLYTIEKELGRIDGLHVTMVGDLKYGRTVHSLARLLALFTGHLHFISPPELMLPVEIQHELAARNVSFTRGHDLEEWLSKSDVLYVTRVQKERFSDDTLYEKVKNAFVVTPDTMKHAQHKMALMHPLPRVGEIEEAVDGDPRAAYFRQMEYGLFVRMALLALVLKKQDL